MPAIRVTNGPQKGTIYQIEDVGIVIGKASECDIQLYDAMVEQMHARIYRMGEMYFIRNLAESGSTYVNDEQITEELLREGDQIRVGSTGLAFDSSRATVRAVEESDYVLSDFMLDVDDDDILSPSMEVPDGGSRLQRDMHIIREFIELGTEQKTANQYMDTATDFVMKNVGCDVAAILLRQPDGRTKLGAATRRQKSASSVADVIALYAMKNRKALLIADAEGDARFKHSPSVADAHVHSVVCIPMFVRDEAKGCLYLGNDELNGVFPPDDFYLARVIGMEIGMVLDNLATFDQQNEVVQSVVKALSMALDMHDPIMMGHSERVGKFSASVGEFLGFNAEQVNDLYLAGVLHDIGRLGQNDDIVETQRAILRGEEKPIVEHVKLGVKILSEIVTLDRLIPIVKAHHEFWDGSGLPDGLSREDIPLGGRVLCAANVLDEFLYPLVPEKDPMSVGEAMKEMKLLGGSKLDPKVVNAFMIAYRKGKLSLEDSTDISI